MKTLVHYLVAVILVLLGIALLCSPSHPADTRSQLRAAPGDNSQVLDRPAFRATMRLA